MLLPVPSLQSQCFSPHPIRKVPRAMLVLLLNGNRDYIHLSIARANLQAPKSNAGPNARGSRGCVLLSSACMLDLAACCRLTRAEGRNRGSRLEHGAWLLRRDILGVAGRACGSDVQQPGSTSWVPFDRHTWRHLFFRNRPFRREITPSYQSVEPKPACAVQRAMTNAMLNCIPEQGNKWRNALQLVYEVSNNRSYNEHLSAELSTRCMESHRLSTGGIDTGGWLKCRLSSFAPLESAMLDRVMRDSNMATGDSGNRTIRPSAAVVGLLCSYQRPAGQHLAFFQIIRACCPAGRWYEHNFPPRK